jgi:DNA-binding SARP family transcriptional activator
MDATALDVPVARISLLDGFSVHLPGDTPVAVEEVLPHGVQRLVVRLCLAGRHSRTALAGQLWPDAPEVRAHGSLRSALWKLQKVAPGLIAVSGEALVLSPRVRVDVRELVEWAHRAADPRYRVEDLGLPDTWFRGDLLPGWYDDWVLLERERLRQLRMHALELVAARLVDEGRHSRALQVAYAAVRAEPLRESAHRTVVRVHLAEGNVVEALRAYDTFRALLQEELGVVPTEQMTRLVAGIPMARTPVR